MIALNKTEMDFLRDFADNADGCKGIYEEYSGRVMYGSKCFGIIVGQYESPAKVFGWLIHNLMEDDEVSDLAIRLLEHGIKEDNMGLDSIIYFPHFQWDQDSEELDEENEDEE